MIQSIDSTMGRCCPSTSTITAERVPQERQTRTPFWTSALPAPQDFGATRRIRHRILLFEHPICSVHRVARVELVPKHKATKKVVVCLVLLGSTRNWFLPLPWNSVSIVRQGSIRCPEMQHVDNVRLVKSNLFLVNRRARNVVPDSFNKQQGAILASLVQQEHSRMLRAPRRNVSIVRLGFRNIWKAKHCVFPVCLVNIKTLQEHNRVRNVETIRLPTPVDVHLAILVVVVPKRKKGVLDVSVVTLVKRELVLVVVANNVRRVNLVRPMMLRLIRVHVAIQAIIKKNWVKLRVCHAFQERTKNMLDQQHV